MTDQWFPEVEGGGEYECKGTTGRGFLGDGTVLYPDCGKGYVNLHTYWYSHKCMYTKMSILLYINLKIKTNDSISGF